MSPGAVIKPEVLSVELATQEGEGHHEPLHLVSAG